MTASEKNRINRSEDESSKQFQHEANSDRRLAGIVSFLPDPTFVIDKKGIVISWNRAIEDLTGIKAQDILGKGDYEYAVPFYGVKRPVLVDLVHNQDPKLESEYNSLQRDGMNPCRRGILAILWQEWFLHLGQRCSAIRRLRQYCRSNRILARCNRPQEGRRSSKRK
jgi:PAS domain-containing protein